MESISTRIGPKWPQLFFKLKLEPRMRYDIETRHSGEPTEIQYRSCSRESIEIWLKKFPAHVEEKEKIKELLLCLWEIKDLKSFATSFAKSVGVHLSQDMLDEGTIEQAHGRPIVVPQKALPRLEASPESQLEASGGVWTTRSGELGPSLPHREPLESFKSRLFMTTAGPAAAVHGTVTAPTIHGFHRKEVKSKVVFPRSDTEAEYTKRESIERKVPEGVKSEDGTKMDSHYVGIHPLRTIVPKGASVVGGSSDMARSISGAGVLVCAHTNRFHRYALLDVSQRLSPQTWRQFGSYLGLDETFLRELEEEEDEIEERYYSILMEWIGRGHATFQHLCEALSHFNENVALTILKDRLDSETDIVISSIEYT